MCKTQILATIAPEGPREDPPTASPGREHGTNQVIIKTKAPSRYVRDGGVHRHTIESLALTSWQRAALASSPITGN
jgi:hypothetical protein